MAHKKFILKFEGDSLLEIMKAVDRSCSKTMNFYMGKTSLEPHIDNVDVVKGVIVVVDLFSDSLDSVNITVDNTGSSRCLEISSQNNQVIHHLGNDLTKNIELDISLVELELCYMKVKNKDKRSVLFSKVADILGRSLTLDYSDTCRVLELLSSQV